MSRGLQRVQDVWQEWETGLSFGPAIKILEETWGPAWCHGYERRFFNWRKLIIDAVEARMISHSIDANRAASWLDNVRRRKRWSLNNLSKNLGAIKNLSAVNHV
ncbi:transcriptional activator of glycolytic enzymes-domain-containing protein [Phlyctochytrium arcticum]|nr:transcriptional activator of glycolytic enzymes-domain-containing protein [Phlyctochytrium arcticum]